LGDYRSMLAIGLQLHQQGYTLAKEKFQQVARVALAQKDIEFAWKAAMILY
jgi:hypothetical protein